MSTSTPTTDALTPDAGDIAYRPLLGGAVASLILGVVSPVIIPAARDGLQSCLLLCPAPILGIVLGMRALGRIRQSPEQWSGQKLAKVGTLLSAICLVSGLGLAGYVAATEVPDGYAATTFLDLKPDEVEQRGDVLIPPDIAALDGEKVFIKGYMRPDSTPYRSNISQFLLVRDNQQCCFGKLSDVNFFDQVAVTMTNKKTVDYSGGVYRMGGTLRVDPRNIRRGQPVYTLEADYAE